MMNDIDQIRLNFSEESLFTLNIILGFIMYGVALELSLEDFKRVFRKPKAPLIGIFSQFLFLPAITFVLVYFLEPIPSIALGMMLVAACPGGNISNFICSLANGNVALSVSLTAFATLGAIILTPINFAFWSSMYTPAEELLQVISVDTWKMIKTVLLLLGLPLILGMWTAHRFPLFTARITKTVKVLSLIFFAGFVVVALSNNFSYFLDYIEYVILIVFVHNLIGLFGGYSLAFLARLPVEDRRSISIETGIQNSGIALVLIFNFFDGIGGMAIIAAWWGIWHIIAGLSLAVLWSKRPTGKTPLVSES